MPKKYRIAVIGHTGRGNYGHHLDTVWLQIPNVEIVAVADADEQGRRAAQKRLNAGNAYADYRDMLKKERPEIVSVALRHLDQHRDMVVACAEAGANIYLEKPMCRTLAEADQMVSACEKHHVKLAISHQTRYSPRIERIKEMISKGMIGDVLEMRGRGKEDSRVGGQDLMVLGTHIMDLMRYLAGDAHWCHARVGVKGPAGVKAATKDDVREGGEGMGPIAGNNITSQFGFDNGIVGYFASQKAARKRGEPHRFGLEIRGSRGIIQVTTGSRPPAFYLADPGWFPGRSGVKWQEITSAGLGKPETIKDTSLLIGNVWIVKDLIEAIEKDRQPRGSIYDARAALEMIMAVYESHRLKRTVEIPLKNRRHPLTML